MSRTSKTCAPALRHFNGQALQWSGAVIMKGWRAKSSGRGRNPTDCRLFCPHRRPRRLEAAAAALDREIEQNTRRAQGGASKPDDDAAVPAADADDEDMPAPEGDNEGEAEAAPEPLPEAPEEEPEEPPPPVPAPPPPKPKPEPPKLFNPTDPAYIAGKGAIPACALHPVACLDSLRSPSVRYGTASAGEML